MSTLNQNWLQQSAIQDNIRSAGLFKISSGIILFVILSALVNYLIGKVEFNPVILSSLFFILPIYSL
jgi:hypothetical protein